MFRWLRNLFGSKELRNFEEKIKKESMIIVGGKVVCDYCHDDCGQCSNGRRITRLQKEYDIIMSTM